MHLYSLSIAARATLNLHSLNNEGGEGNQIQTRTVNVVAGDGRLHTVNAVSGDMFKHIQTEHFYRRGRGEMPLCAACRHFDANRATADPEFMARVSDMTPAGVLDELLRTCALDDVAGNLITQGSRSIPRKSVVEFGWVVGVPDVTVTEQYFHVKYAPDRRETQRESTEDRSGNLGQAIFHRPASSGVYAVVTHLELSRIGYNDLTQRYVIDSNDRTDRYRRLLESVFYTFMEPNGAMRSTQHPHVTGFEGVVSLSTRPVPAPTISPLNAGYRHEIDEIAGAINTLHADSVEIRRFDTPAQFANVMTTVIEETTPYVIRD